MKIIYSENEDIAKYFSDTTKKKWCYDYKISIVIPTRERIDLLQQCLESILYNSSEERLFEVIFIVDFDDTKTINFLRSITQNFNFYCPHTGDMLSSMSIVIVNRSTFMQRDYNNVGANMAKGDLVFILNDDCIIETKNWDKKLIEFYEKNKPEDDIMLIGCLDNTHNGLTKSDRGHARTMESFGACFPIFTKTFVKIFNGVFPPEVKMWGADTIAHKMFSILGRFYRCDYVNINHFTFHCGNRDEDATNAHVRHCSDQGIAPGDMMPYVRKIKEHIVNKNNHNISRKKNAINEYKFY